MKATVLEGGRSGGSSAGSRSAPESVVSQERLLPFLLNPRSYRHRPRTVRLLQTHASFVFLAPPFVFKLKKPVNFGFLDFSTLEKRRHFCEREVELNRRLSPGIYLGIVPISIRQGRLRFGDRGQVVEYAVKMRRLSDRFFLNRLVEQGEAGPGQVNRIVQTLKRFYEAQQPSAAILAWGHINRLRISTDENFRQVEPFVGPSGIISRPAFRTIREYTDRFYHRNRRLFASRIRERRILDCHGDLHLEHIHVTPRALHIYDCIEFNDRFRYVDVASDLAFLAMDLDYEGRPDLSRHLTARMASALHDEGLLRLMDFYKCYRACVRGKVECLRSVAHAATNEDRRASAGRARRYFQLALRYAVAGSRPLALVVMGRVGSGKSTLARALGAELGWEVLSSDTIRKSIAGLPLRVRGDAAARKRLYSAAMTEATYGRMFRLAEARLRDGRSIVLDATFSRSRHRRALARRFGRRGFIGRFVEVRAETAVVRRRLRRRATLGNQVSDARLEDLDRLNRKYQPPVEIPWPRRCVISTTLSVERALTTALRKLTRLQATTPWPTDGAEKLLAVAGTQATVSRAGASRRGREQLKAVLCQFKGGLPPGPEAD